ncbi:hypothetical protein J6590_032208 [Homalodisca vitripennis]|nr:hypothetical protein J6590_032208 [Homalodisca vitripennis]
MIRWAQALTLAQWTPVKFQNATRGRGAGSAGNDNSFPVHSGMHVTIRLGACKRTEMEVGWTALPNHF